MLKTPPRMLLRGYETLENTFMLPVMIISRREMSPRSTIIIVFIIVAMASLLALSAYAFAGWALWKLLWLAIGYYGW